MEVLSVLIVVVAIVVSLAVAQGAQQRWLATLEAVSKKYDLVVDPGSFWRSASAGGVVEGMPLAFDTYQVRHGKSSVTYTRIVARPPYLRPDLTLKPEGVGALLGKIFQGSDLKVGDARFDDQVLVRGEERQIRALLDGETRKQVQAALDLDIVVEDGQVRWTKKGRVRDVDELQTMAQAVLDLARLLNPEGERSRLLRIVQTERDQEVVSGALRTLLDQGTLTPAEEQGLLEHPQIHVRLTAAPLLGVKAWPVVEAIARDARLPSAQRTHALVILRRLDLHRAVPLALELVAQSTPGELSIAALELLDAAATCPPQADLLESVGIRSAPLRKALAACLQHSTEPVEAQLLEILADPDDEVAIAAAQALALQGSTAAVLPLRERSKGLFADGDLRRAAEAAIAAIQQQVGRGLGGSLSLLREREAEGGLALPEGEEEA